jgi:hypothetical protein
MLSTLRSLANAILGKTGNPDRLDTAMRMAMDADFSDRGERSTSEREPAPNIDPAGMGGLRALAERQERAG